MSRVRPGSQAGSFCRALGQGWRLEATIVQREIELREQVR